MAKTIKVSYRYVDGAHCFASHDPRAAGLCVASTDLRAAYDEVTRQLNILLQKNHGGQPGRCAPKTPYDVFRAWVRKVVEDAADDIMPIPAASVIWHQQRQEAA